MLRIKRAITARITRARRLPLGAAAGDLFVRDVQMDTPCRYVHFDLVTRLDESERPTDETFRRHVKDAGAVTGAAHAGIRNAQHVAHTLFHELFRNRQHAPFRHARAAFGPPILEDENVVRRDVEIVALYLASHMVVVFERNNFATMTQQPLVGGRRFHHAAARSKITGEYGGRTLPRKPEPTRDSTNPVNNLP